MIGGPGAYQEIHWRSNDLDLVDGRKIVAVASLSSHYQSADIMADEQILLAVIEIQSQVADLHVPPGSPRSPRPLPSSLFTRVDGFHTSSPRRISSNRLIWQASTPRCVPERWCIGR